MVFAHEVLSVYINRKSVFKGFTANHHFLSSFIEGCSHTCMRSSRCHNVSDRMTVASLYRGIWLFTAADTFHPVSNMIVRQRISTCVGRGHYFFCLRKAHLR